MLHECTHCAYVSRDFSGRLSEAYWLDHDQTRGALPNKLPYNLFLHFVQRLTFYNMFLVQRLLACLCGHNNTTFVSFYINQRDKMDTHPMFERVSEEELEKDPAAGLLYEVCAERGTSFLKNQENVRKRDDSCHGSYFLSCIC